MGEWQQYKLASHVPSRDVFLTRDAEGIERFAEMDSTDHFVWVVDGDVEYPPSYPDWKPQEWRTLRDDEDFRPN